jgi:hypothetical protein
MLRVSRDSVIYLGAAGNRQSYHVPRMLRCKDIDDLKRWVGVPNSVFRQNTQAQTRRAIPTRPPTSLIDKSAAVTAQLRGESNPQKVKELKDGLYRDLREHYGALKQMTDAYVYGDSDLLVDWKGPLSYYQEQHLVPVWAYYDVVVESGAVLEFGEGTNVLSAKKLVIEQGGRIRATGSLTLNVSSIVRSN